MANKKSGYLRFKCGGCGAIVKEDQIDLADALSRILMIVSQQKRLHECTEIQTGVAVWIGGTYHTEEDI